MNESRLTSGHRRTYFVSLRTSHLKQYLTEKVASDVKLKTFIELVIRVHVHGSLFRETSLHSLLIRGQDSRDRSTTDLNGLTILSRFFRLPKRQSWHNEIVLTTSSFFKNRLQNVPSELMNDDNLVAISVGFVYKANMPAAVVWLFGRLSRMTYRFSLRICPSNKLTFSLDAACPNTS